MRKKDTLYIVMPAYNEEENIKDVVLSWYPKLELASDDSKLVVADSGSSDKTHEILLEMKEQYPKIEILEDTDRQHGPKVIALYDYAIKNNADYIFQTDSDGQTKPEQFDRFWDMREQYAAIIGNRNRREDGKSRAFVEKVVCMMLKMYFGVKVPDANAPFRLMKSNAVKKYLYNMEPDFNLPNIMMTTFLVYYGENVKFKPISFRPRQKGVNSINIKKIIKIGWKAQKDFREFRKKMRVEEQNGDAVEVVEKCECEIVEVDEEKNGE